MWMGDMETDFMEKIEENVSWQHVDILFAPHHGRSSGRVPNPILEKLSPKVIVIGEAPSEDLNYYNNCNTITQNRAGDIYFCCNSNYWVDIYVSNPNYQSPFFLTYRDAARPIGPRGTNYLGSLYLGRN